jgi:hypothetical protein
MGAAAVWVGLEGVDQAPGEAAGERPRQAGAPRFGHCLPVRCGRARFGAGEEGSADRGGPSARREDARQGRAGGNPTGGDQREVDAGADQASRARIP